MHDIRAIRLDPDRFDAGWAARGLPASAAEIVSLDEARRAAQTALQQAQSRRNALSGLIGKARAAQDASAAEALLAEVEGLKRDIAVHGQTDADLGAQLQALLATLPNLPDLDTPAGADESGNVEVRRWGDPGSGAAARDHVDLGAALGLMDFDEAARISGARFVVLRGGLARLERALGQFMLDVHTQENGYVEVSPPLLVRDRALFGTGQLPKFADDLFRTTDDYWLIPTAEVSLTNAAAGQITPDDRLPMRLTALTPCFRSEAGASGRDTRGMIRQHQFQKVELVSITTPDQSAAEHERMVDCAEGILKRLELPFRTVRLCAGDMGFTARRTYDLEVWLPSQKAYREISSCSNCGDFQARRMDARFKRAGEKGAAFVHSLNGSGLAVGRALVAVMENYQDEDGSIAIPAALRSYMGGLTRIGSESR